MSIETKCLYCGEPNPSTEHILKCREIADSREGPPSVPDRPPSYFAMIRLKAMVKAGEFLEIHSASRHYVTVSGERTGKLEITDQGHFRPRALRGDPYRLRYFQVHSLRMGVQEELAITPIVVSILADAGSQVMLTTAPPLNGYTIEVENELDKDLEFELVIEGDLVLGPS